MTDLVLLERDQFRELVFDRDKYACVICGADGQDAHHIMERRLFPNGGYYLENGATLCGPCHLRAEQTTLTVSQILEAIGASHPVLPPHLYGDQAYDKWGNPILPNGTRLRGELYDDPSVRKVLAPVLHEFVSRVKYPRTYHLPFSPAVTDDDRIMGSYIGFEGYEVVVTEKMDGENTSWYRDGMHARSLDYEPHPSRDYVKSMWASKVHDIPDNYRICGENLYAKHSIYYPNLNSYFQVFGVWDGLTCLSWQETLEWTALLGLTLVPVLYMGEWDEEYVMNLALRLPKDKSEGLVVRTTAAIHMRDWPIKVGKFVREGHVQTHGHWARQQVIPNQLGE